VQDRAVAEAAGQVERRRARPVTHIHTRATTQKLL
jgi:hypothetical protein